jgi:septal ring factor EnvC (AmiA/AmiB activator)
MSESTQIEKESLEKMENDFTTIMRRWLIECVKLFIGEIQERQQKHENILDVLHTRIELLAKSFPDTEVLTKIGKLEKDFKQFDQKLMSLGQTLSSDIIDKQNGTLEAFKGVHEDLLRLNDSIEILKHETKTNDNVFTESLSRITETTKKPIEKLNSLERSLLATIKSQDQQITNLNEKLQTQTEKLSKLEIIINEKLKKTQPSLFEMIFGKSL